MNVEPIITAGFVVRSTLKEWAEIEEFLESLPDTNLIFAKKAPGNTKLYIVKVKGNGKDSGWEI